MHRPLTESPIFRVTRRDFSLFCHSIRPLDAALAMVKALFRIVGQISIFYRKNATVMFAVISGNRCASVVSMLST